MRSQNLMEQYLASKGFVVLAINYRGGSGFGREFQDLAVNDWLNGQAKDPGAAADYLRTLPYVNGKVGIYGGSYGGMQSMAAAFGGSIVRAPTLVHGEASEVTHDGGGLLEGMPPAFMAARYHSLAVDPATLPPELRVTAMSESDRVVMGIRHIALPLEGVQFHPESVLTPQGPHLLANFLRQAGEGEAARLDEATGSFATAGLVEAATR